MLTSLASLNYTDTISATLICTELNTSIPPFIKVTLHVLELINPPLGVALPDLSERLVLVPPLLHVLLVDLVHSCLSLELTKLVE